jgi:hypothetical protein
MSVIAATIVADASVNNLSNNLAQTLYISETERTGSMTTAAFDNYLNFVGDWDKWVAGLTVDASSTDLSGSASIVDVAKDSDEATVFSWTDVSSFASSSTLYDVRFETQTTGDALKSVNIADFITLSASNVRETDLHFTVSSATNTVTTADISGAGSINLETTVQSSYYKNANSTAVSTDIVYACNGGVIQVVKEDNILAADKIGFGAGNSAAPLEGDLDVLYAEYSVAEGATETVSADVSSMTIDSATLTDAIQSLLAGVADLADVNDLDAVKTKLRTFNSNGEANDTFKGFTHTGTEVDLEFVITLGGTSDTKTVNLKPQIFFNQYQTTPAAVIGV